MSSERLSLRGSEGTVSVAIWKPTRAERVVVIAHGYGEHIGRYEHVAADLAARGAVVYGPDHLGHGESDGERVLIADLEHVVDDLDRVIGSAQDAHPGLPTVLVGHSLGGLIATRYVQRPGRRPLAGLALSGPAVGLGPAVEQMRASPEIAEAPIDVSVLSRDSAVGEAYAADPLVWHGAWKPATLESLARATAEVDAGPIFDLPVFWVHGTDDQLVPLELARPAVQRLAGAALEEHVRQGARHEVLNEIDKDEVLAALGAFVERVSSR